MSQELHPFWKGVQDEFQKQGFLDAAVSALAPVSEALANPYVAAGVAGGLGLAGMGIVGARAARAAKASAGAAGEAAKKGFGWKGLAAAGGAGALGTAYLMSGKKREE